MTIIQIEAAVKNFKAGTVSFNKGTIISILYGNSWYPVRAMACHIFNKDVTTDEAISLFSELIYVKTKKVKYTSNFPVQLSDTERFAEIKELATA